MFLLNLMFFKIYLYQNRVDYVSDMLNSSVINSVALKTILLQITLIVNAYISLMYVYTTNVANNIMLYVALLVVVALSIVLNHIYKSPNNIGGDYLTPNSKRIVSFIVSMGLLAILTIYLKAYYLKNMLYIGAFLYLINIPLYSKLRSLYNNELLQSQDYCRHLFKYMFFKPIKRLSKTLWIFVDFVISEKVITSAIETINRQSITLFFKLNPKKGFAGIVFIIIGIAIFIISFIRAGQ